MNDLNAARIVLTGAGGLLGSAFRQRLVGADLICMGRQALAVDQAADWMARLQHHQPTLILHCAADTRVDAAEVDPAAAWQANALLPELLAQVARRTGARMVHFSSTGCYGEAADGGDAPHGDYAPLLARSVHHRAKVAGEMAVRGSGAEALILRLGWLYGGGADAPRNFVMARIREARGRDELPSDPTQRGNPTWVEDVVTQTLTLLDANVAGTFNCVAQGSASRLEYVQCILAAAGLPTRLVPQRFERQAPVSPNEAARNDKLAWLGLDVMPPWDEALKRYVAQLISSELAA